MHLEGTALSVTLHDVAWVRGFLGHSETGTLVLR